MSCFVKLRMVEITMDLVTRKLAEKHSMTSNVLVHRRNETRTPCCLGELMYYYAINLVTTMPTLQDPDSSRL